MNHLNAKISAYGRDVVKARCSYIKKKHNKTAYYTCLPPVGDEQVLLVIATKRHVIVDGEFITGINEDRLNKFDKLQKELGLPDIFLCFVDSKNGLVYGELLSKLREIKEFFGTQYPHYKICPNGRIVMWPIHKMPTIFKMSESELAELRALQVDNKQDKTQFRLF
jgi:hypothetical protein